MKELKDVLGMVADGLKSFAEGMGMIAGKMDALAQSMGDTETKPEVPKQKATKVQPEKAEKKTAKKPVATAAPKRPAPKAVLKATPDKKAAPEKKAALEKKGAPEKKEALTASDTVLEVISDSGNGIGPGGIMEKTGFDKKKVSNILHRLKQQGKIENSQRGMYSRKG